MPPQGPRKGVPPTLPFDFASASSPDPALAPQPRVFGVAELGRVVKRSVDGMFGDGALVRGEVMGVSLSTGGHLYFTLKDESERASIKVVVFSTELTPRVRGIVTNGAKLRLRVRPSYWVEGGQLSFRADRVDVEGKGELLAALEALKEQLRSEGLLDPKRKRPLPKDPRVIGVVTSETGAVIHDIVKVARQRGGARILLAPTRVQGAGAAESIRRALEQLARVEEVDVIIVGRGGGSFDDLLPFSDEALARAVAACRVPVVSAVGHDVDNPIIDFVADARAATPSQAAEFVVADRAGRKRLLAEKRVRMARAVKTRLAGERSRVLAVRRAFADPRLVLSELQRSRDALHDRLAQALRRTLALGARRRSEAEGRLARVHPQAVLARERGRLHALDARLDAAVRRKLSTARNVASKRIATLDALSPLKVLGRGYAIALGPTGRAIHRATEVQRGDAVRVRLHDGELRATVNDVDPERSGS